MSENYTIKLRCFKDINGLGDPNQLGVAIMYLLGTTNISAFSHK